MSVENIEILIIGDNSLETVGGEQESTKIILDGIRDNYSTGMIQPGNIIDKNDKVHYFKMTKETRLKHLIQNPYSFFKYIVRVRKIILSSKPQIIHSQAQVSFFIVALFKKMNLIPNNIILVHTERGLYTKYNDFIKRVFMFFLKEVDTLVTTTEFNKKYWKQALKNKAININYNVIPNTAGRIYEGFDESREKHSKTPLIVGFSGRYTEWKNWPLAIKISEALNNELKDNLNIKMAVGCLDDKSENATLTMFKYLKNILGDRFEGKININLEEMNEFYYDIDVFVLTSKHNTESFGRTLIEAMSRKTAVLTTDAGGSVEVVGDLDNVCNSSDEFVDKIISFYKDSKKLDYEKNRNLQRVKSEYSYESNILKHIELYDDLLNK